MRNLYDVLEISPKASEEVIKSAYRALAKKYHPDLGISILNEKMAEINYAYEILINPVTRHEYDKSINNDSVDSNDYVNIFDGLSAKDFFKVIDLKCKLVPTEYSLTSIGLTSILVKIKVKNYYDDPIIAIKGRIRFYDFFGNEYFIDGKQLEFFDQDLFIKRNHLYGVDDEIRIVIDENPNIKIIFIEFKEMIFENGEKWQQKDPLWVYPQNNISTDEYTKLKRIYSIEDPWKPFKKEQYWGCVCGKYNLISDTRCIKCKRSIEDSALNTESIDERFNALLKKDAEIDKRRHRRNLAILIPIAITFIIAFIWLIMPVDKEKIYATAKEYEAGNENYKAYRTYEKIPDYLDSQFLMQSLSAKIYEDAIKAYEVKNYRATQQYLTAIEGHQAVNALKTLCDHYIFESEHKTFASSVVLLEAKRKLLIALAQFSNPNGTYLEQECFKAASSLYYTDVKLNTHWYCEGVGYIRLDADSESNDGELALGNSFRQVGDGKYYRLETVEFDGTQYVEIQYGEYEYASSVRILGFNPLDSSNPTELYIFNIADGKNYTLTLYNPY